ncbi:MAG: efflux RND transporter periplasmic adaptor subunit [Terracidiphilus sp.]|jgi:HlyD family secretion protein
MATAVDPIREKAPMVIPIAAPAKPALIRRNYHWARWALAIGMILALAIVYEVWRTHAQNAVTYQTAPLERGTVQASVTATGSVNAVVDVQVGSQVSGNIKALYADFNTKVTKGQLVALIDPAVFQTQVDQAQASRSSALSAVATAAAQVQKANSDLSGTMAGARSAASVMAKDSAVAVNAQAQYGRLDSLFNDGITSKQDHEAAKASADAATAQVAADQATVDESKQTIQSAQDQVTVTKTQLGSAKGLESQASASLAQANLNLAHTRITAPVDGTVIARRMDVGQTVAASFAAPTIFEIAQDLTKMQLDTNVDESDVGNIQVGQNATFSVDAYPTTTFQGQVTAVRKAPIITTNVVTYDVVIAVSNPDLKLFPGMTANARILTAKLNDTFKVPNAVLRIHPSAAMLKQFGLSAAPAGKQQVYVLRNGKLKAVPVEFGISDGQFTAVSSSGLQAGDQIVQRFSSAATATTATAPSSAPGGSTGRTPRL